MKLFQSAFNKFALVGAICLGFLYFDVVTKLTKKPPISREDILLEAAHKRFRINSVSVSGKDVTDFPKMTGRSSFKNTYIKLLKDALAKEKIAKTPSIVARTESSLKKLKPIILKLSQTDGDGFQREVKILVKNTADCNLTNPPKVANVGQLKGAFCVDPLFEYPGGFDERWPISTTIIDWGRMPEFQNVRHQWEDYVLAAVTEVVAAEFYKLYRETGKLTLL